MLNKRGQALSIIAFFAVIVAIFIVSIVIITMTNKVISPFQDTISNISTTAANNVGYIKDSVNTWWDYAVVLIFFLNTIMLFYSAFMVDVHPAFLVLYILALAFLFIFGTTALGTVQQIWGTDAMAEGLGYMDITYWLLNNFTIVLLGIAILSGIVMYAKFKLGGQGA